MGSVASRRRECGRPEYRSGVVQGHGRSGERLIVVESDESTNPRQGVFRPNQCPHIGRRRVPSVKNVREELCIPGGGNFVLSRATLFTGVRIV